MSEDLEAALEPVADFHSAGSINENTVLAAHIRSLGAEPRGDVWTIAKRSLKSGHSIRQAAEIAVLGKVSDETPDQPSRQSSDPVPVSPITPVGLSFSTGSSRTSNRQTPVLPTDFEPLDWYPKRYSAGDIDGDGAKKLLGTPSIPLASVLVREMAQNSWDARTGECEVEFTMNMRELTQYETDLLREKCLPESAPDVDIVESLEDPIWVLEVSDRGTHGLRGPTRNDLEVADGVPTNFIDLVFNLGGKHEISASGGTYGFGKTVAYKASRLGTVLIWSRIRDGEKFEDRIIGSSIGESFNHERFRYTGRHWWGRMEDEFIQPLRGASAAQLGESLFVRGFSEHETGTSILVLIPELGGGDPESDVAQLVEAVRWHLWPKTMAAQVGDVRMSIRVQMNGQDIEIFSKDLENPILDSMSSSLTHLREVQSRPGRSGKELVSNEIEVHEVWCRSPLTLLGHLALQRFQERDLQTNAEEIIPFEQPTCHIALMRNSAELVVKYLPGLPLDVPGFGWTGVFKPVRELDGVFAASEPPAHDDWVPGGIGNKREASFVRVALRRIREISNEFAQPSDLTPDSVNNYGSVAGLADALSGLIPAVSGNRPERGSSASKSGTSRSAKKPKVEVCGQLLAPPQESDLRLMALQLSISGAGHPVTLIATGGIGVEGGTDSAEEGVSILYWDLQKPDLSNPAQPRRRVSDRFTTDADECWLVLQAPSELAVDVQIEVESDG